ncbi:peptidoglycan-binding domain-containing protein [Clostridium paraputrificum]|uniref:peptidoglycan-binding domain-containing protein n=1 Tax=Clostridium TaxID=1485 RepID=UPI003D34BB4D
MKKKVSLMLVVLSIIAIGSSTFSGLTVSAKTIQPVQLEEKELNTINPYSKSARDYYLTMTFRGYTWLSGQIIGFGSGYVNSGEPVKCLQSMLNYLIGAGLDVDGSYGYASRDALRNFQSKYGLQVDGYAGPATYQKLGQLIFG